MGKKQQRKDKAETSVTGYLEKMRADGVEGMEGAQRVDNDSSLRILFDTILTCGTTLIFYLLSGVLGTGLPGLGTEHLPGELFA